MNVKCPACKKGHGELAPGEYRCVCTAEFRVESEANPEELDKYHYFPSWYKEHTWDVFSGPGVRGFAGRHLGEISRDWMGDFKAFKLTEVPDTRRGHRGEKRLEVGESRSGFATRNDASEWVAGELPNPKGRRAGLKSRRIKGQRREGAAASLRDVKESAGISESRNPGMSYRPDEIAETMEGVSKELYSALWKIVVTLKPTQAVYYDGLTERQLVGRMKKNKESAETIANLKEVLKKEEAALKAWMDEGRQNPAMMHNPLYWRRSPVKVIPDVIDPETGKPGLGVVKWGNHWWAVDLGKEYEGNFSDEMIEHQFLGSMFETRKALIKVIEKWGPSYLRNSYSRFPDRVPKYWLENPHQAGRGRITPAGWREHPKHMPIPKGWQAAPSKGPAGMRVSKARHDMVWIIKSTPTTPPQVAQKAGVPRKYSRGTGRRASAPVAPGSFEQYTLEESMERLRPASGGAQESYARVMAARMGEKARQKLRASRNPLDMQLTEREQKGIGPHLSLYGMKDGAYKFGTVGGEDMPKSTVADINDDVVVLKIPGHKYWLSHSLSGGSEYGYVGAEYRIYLRLDDRPDYPLVRRIASFPVRAS